MAGNAMIQDESRRKSFTNQRKTIYLVHNMFEVWKNAKIEAGYKRGSDSDFAAYLLYVLISLNL